MLACVWPDATRFSAGMLHVTAHVNGEKPPH